MQDDKLKKEALLEMLRAEIAKLLCADDVSEEDKLSRIKLAQAIIENRGEEYEFVSGKRETGKKGG